MFQKWLAVRSGSGQNCEKNIVINGNKKCINISAAVCMPLSA
jgi:hypothetical protein